MQQNGLLTLWGLQGKLVKSYDTSSRLDDASTSIFGHFERTNVKLGDTQQTDIVRDSADNDSNLVTALVVGLDLTKDI